MSENVLENGTEVEFYKHGCTHSYSRRNALEHCGAERRVQIILYMVHPAPLALAAGLHCTALLCSALLTYVAYRHIIVVIE
jgi:hypothetical protein